MAARNTNITADPGAAVAVSDGAILSVRVYLYNGAVVLQATATNVAPTSQEGGLPISAGQTLAADLTLAEIFPGIGPEAMYLWCFAIGKRAVMSVSHA